MTPDSLPTLVKRASPLFTLFMAITSCFGTASLAGPAFPYNVRVRDYNGWNSSVKGDTNTVGMSGATVALPNSISSAEGNPAGFAMELSALSVQLNKNTIRDSAIQKSGDQKYDTNQWGLAVSPPPWGFGISYYSPSTESGRYTSINTGHDVNTEISVKELRLTVARAFFDSQLSLGASIRILKAVREIGGFGDNAMATSFQLGALYRLPDHLILGLSFTPHVTIDPASTPSTQVEIAGFNRAIIAPAVLAAGLGWVPNRFFRVGLSVYMIGPTKNTALLYDQTQAYGQKLSVEPRVGASYVIAEYSNFKIELAAGSYYEPSRADGESNRIHATTGLEVNPYFFNTGIGLDIAHEYHDLMISVGIDLVRTLRTFDIIPKDPVPAYSGFFPKPQVVSADGLPEGITKGETKTMTPINLDDVGSIIREIPDKIKEKVNSAPEPAVKRKKQARRTRKLTPYNQGVPPAQNPAPKAKPKSTPKKPGSNNGNINLGT